MKINIYKFDIDRFIYHHHHNSKMNGLEYIPSPPPVFFVSFLLLLVVSSLTQILQVSMQLASIQILCTEQNCHLSWNSLHFSGWYLSIQSGCGLGGVVVLSVGLVVVRMVVVRRGGRAVDLGGLAVDLGGLAVDLGGTGVLTVPLSFPPWQVLQALAQLNGIHLGLAPHSPFRAHS